MHSGAKSHFLVFFFFGALFALLLLFNEYGISFTQNPSHELAFILLTVLARRCTHCQWFEAALYVQALEFTVSLGALGFAAFAGGLLFLEDAFLVRLRRGADDDATLPMYCLAQIYF